MQFVLGNRVMDGAGGTETHLVTIGDQLLRLGHEVVIYSPQLGPFADHARRRGIDVVDELRRLPGECDVVFAQDALVVYDLAERFPRARCVFRVCGDSFDFQSPPQVEGLVDLTVVLSDRYAQLARACAVTAPLLRLRVPVDIDRLVPVGSIRARPRHAVVLGNYPDRVQVVTEAWKRHGIEVSQVGGATQRYDIAAALEPADIVVAKSRAALDAMACGRAVYVYDTFGGDGWVTPATYAALEADHFAGQGTERVIGPAELDGDLADYDPGMGTANRDLVLQHHSARDHVIEFLAALAATPAAERRPAPLHELARLTALAWSWEHVARDSQSAQSWMHDRLVAADQAAEQAMAAAAATAAGAADAAANLHDLRAEFEAAERERADLRARADAAATLQAELEAMHATRAWRLAERYWRSRDRLLRRGR